MKRSKTKRKPSVVRRRKEEDFYTEPNLNPPLTLEEMLQALGPDQRTQRERDIERIRNIGIQLKELKRQARRPSRKTRLRSTRPPA